MSRKRKRKRFFPKHEGSGLAHPYDSSHKVRRAHKTRVEGTDVIKTESGWSLPRFKTDSY